MSRKARRFNNRSTNGKDSSQQIISLFDSHPSVEESTQKASDEPGDDDGNNRFALFTNLKTAEIRKRLLYPVSGIILVALLGLGVMGKNGWLPHTDALSCKRTGWFGRELGANNSASTASGSSGAGLLPFEPAAPAMLTQTSATPQLSKEYLYAGSRLLAVEDANANAAAPADLAVWRPADGTWYVLNSSNQQMTSLQWGAQGDVPIQGDYDADGKTDFSVFRPSNAAGTDSQWFVTFSSGSWTNFSFGANGDQQAVADFDGDGKTDAAVFRPGATNGMWFYIRSSDQVFTSVQFGLSTDKPVPKDYDGDGKADIAVWRNSEAKFYVLRSSDASFQAAQIGQSNDAPVPADYDGDGRADFAVRRGADWIINQSSNNQTQTVAWQQAADIAVQNDYDGDGKVDIAVWRDATGMWYIRQSSLVGQSGELRQAQWGMSGDKPVPAFYRR